MDHEETGFSVKVADQQVRFEFKEHYAAEDVAREAIEDYIRVPRRFQWYIAEGMLSLPTAKWSISVISFFSGVMASGFAFGCAKDTC